MSNSSRKRPKVKEALMFCEGATDLLSDGPFRLKKWPVLRSGLLPFCGLKCTVEWSLGNVVCII